MADYGQKSPLEVGESLLAEVSWLLPEKKGHSYYLVAPRYTRMSAGIKIMYLLCHALNSLGQRAYMVTRPYTPAKLATNPELNTPLLTKSVFDYDFEQGLTPIVIYPEIVAGNPLNASVVVRYVMNVPGLLGGETTYEESEYCIAYSAELARQVKNCRMSLFFPASDPRIYYPDPGIKRSGGCFYAAKYRKFHGGKLFPITDGCIEITRDEANSQTAEQIADIFRRSEVFYAYENTALAIEAVLCGCPVVFLPNDHFKDLIGVDELGLDGMAWGNSPSELERAKNTLTKGRERYLNLFLHVREKLEILILETQIMAAKKKYEKRMNIPQCNPPNFLLLTGMHLETIKNVYHDLGAKELGRTVLRKIFSKLNGHRS